MAVLTLKDYKTFFETLGKDVIASATDADGNIIYANDKFVEISKYSRGELIGQNHRILKSSHHEPAFYDDLWQTISSGKVWRGELKNRAKDGTYYWVDTSIAPILGKNGKPEKYVSVRFLITERKDFEDELTRRRKDSEFLAVATSLLTASLELDSVIQNLADISVPKMADWCSINLIEENFDDEIKLKRVAVAHLDPTKRTIAEKLHYSRQTEGAYDVAKTGKSHFIPVITPDYINKNITDENSRKIIKELGFSSLVRVPISSRGKTIGVISFIYGDSGRKYNRRDLELVEELGQRAGIAIENVRLYNNIREADRKKDEFIATLAHELRNPLAPLSTQSELLQMHIDKENINDPIVKDTASVVGRQVYNMARLLDDLLDISRLMRGKITLKKESVRIAEIIGHAEGTTRHSYRERKVTLRIEKIDPSLTIFADPLRLEQAIVNLLDNASKFNFPGGEVSIGAEYSDGKALIVVADNGSGIDRTILPVIFDMFFQETRSAGAKKGLGIGLALTKNLIKMHGGDITVESEGRGKGARFTVTLPTVDMQNSKQMNRLDTGILVVDDNDDAANSLAQYLKYSGYANVRTASSGEEAIRAGKEMSSDFILMDIRMPGMDGYAVARLMRKDPAFKNSKFIAVTGFGQDEDRQKSAEAGFEHHFTKPIDTKSLLQLLEKQRT